MKYMKNSLLVILASILLIFLMVAMVDADSCPDYGHIGDLVWNDLDFDGIQDFGEPGISGVIVNLSFSDNIPYRSTITDINGNYNFHYVLINKEYYIEFILPIGYEFSPQNQGNDDTIDSDANPITGKTDIFSLSVDEDNNTIDAGMYNCIECKDEVWIDDDYNSTTTGWNIDHFNTIQSGIDIICPNGTVYVYDGKYIENIIIPNYPYIVLGLSIALAIILVIALYKYPEWYVIDLSGIIIGVGAMIIGILEMVIAGLAFFKNKGF